MDAWIWQVWIIAWLIVAMVLGSIGFIFFKDSAPKVTSKLQPQTKTPPLAPLEDEERDIVKKKSKRRKKIIFWTITTLVCIPCFFFVKYSIEMGYIHPAVNVVSGFLFGSILILFSHGMLAAQTVSRATIIAQSAASVGVLSFFATLYLAGVKFALIEPNLTLSLIVFITGFSLFQSVFFGAPLAVVAILGGLLCPLMVSPNDYYMPLLIIHLGFLIFFTLRISSAFNWWWLKLSAYVGGYLWLIIGLAKYWQPHLTLWYIAFLLFCFTSLVFSMNHNKILSTQHDNAQRFSYDTVQLFGFGGIFFISTILFKHAGFDFLTWNYFTLLNIIAIGLASYRLVMYGYLPFLALACTIILLFTWPEPNYLLFTMLTSIYGILYIIFSLIMIYKRRDRIYWSILASCAILGLSLALYLNLTMVN